MILNGQHTSPMLPRKPTPHSAFLEETLNTAPKTALKKTAYISLVRSIMEYGAIVWDLYTTVDTNKLERIQRRTARFIAGDYKSREEGSVTKMLAELELESLQSRPAINTSVQGG
jgi:hypothetical protein